MVDLSKKHMLNEKESEKRIGHLKKSDKIQRLKPVEDYLFELADSYDIDVTYDVIADEIPYFDTLSYTEWGGNLIVSPLCNRFREEQLADAFWHSCKNDLQKPKEPLMDWMKQQVIDGLANKYKDRQTDDNPEYRKALVVLLGSNKLKKHICLNKLRWILKNYGDSVWFKPHPITEFQLIGELKDKFGEEHILHRDTDVYDYLTNADVVFTTHHSETAAFALALGKQIEPIDVYHHRMYGAFSHINRFLFEEHDPVRFINDAFESPFCGIFNPDIDNNWKEKLEDYVEYIMQKRDRFKDKYVVKAKK